MPPTVPGDAETDTDTAGVGVVALADAVRGRRLSAEQSTRAHLARIAELDGELRSLVLVDAEGALAQARRVDDGGRDGALAGVPFVVKDNIDVAGQVTRCCSRATTHDAAAVRPAVAVERLLAAGAVCLGRANMDEFAMGASTQTSASGATRNPWDARRSPGGSSGGPAVAVAAGLAAFALGTDTGGSVREPAAQCGVLGMAPSPGLVPAAGVVPFAAGLDRVAPFARSVADLTRVLAVLAPGRSPRTAGRRVGVVTQLAGPRNSPGVLAALDAAVATARGHGIDVVHVNLPGADAALETYLRVTSAAAVPVLDRYVRTGRAGAEVARRVAIGRRLLADDAHLLGQARAEQDRLTAAATAALERCDVLLSPTMPTTAPLLTARTADPHDVAAGAMADPLTAPYTDCWTVLANLAGLPALSVPAGRDPSDGMPIGVMMAARPGDDGLLLATALLLENAMSGSVDKSVAAC